MSLLLNQTRILALICCAPCLSCSPAQALCCSHSDHGLVPCALPLPHPSASLPSTCALPGPTPHCSVSPQPLMPCLTWLYPDWSPWHPLSCPHQDLRPGGGAWDQSPVVRAAGGGGACEWGLREAKQCCVERQGPCCPGRPHAAPWGSGLHPGPQGLLEVRTSLFQFCISPGWWRMVCSV